VAPTPSPDLSGLNCDAWPGQGTTREANVPFSAPRYPDLRVTSSRCANASGDHYPSLVHVIDVDDDRRIIATLIRPQEHLHVVSISAVGQAVTVTALRAGPVLPSDQQGLAELGGVFSWRFSTTDGEHYTRGAPRRTALPCGPADLRLDAVTKPPRPGYGAHPPASSAILRLTNRSAQPCAVEGYPEVVGATVADGEVASHQQLFGPDGGVLDSTAPPVILLAPRQVASATVDSANETPAGGTALCNTLDKLRVALPSGEALGSIRASLRVCDLEVHPLVPGTTGTAP
jgi:hypothetical protein